MGPPPGVIVNVQHPSLRPCLRRYQSEAVQWMLSKENYGKEEAEKIISGFEAC